jgi:hypothetical protein
MPCRGTGGSRLAVRDEKEEASVQRVRQREQLKGVGPATIAVERLEVLREAGRNAARLDARSTELGGRDLPQIRSEVRGEGSDVSDPESSLAAELVRRDSEGHGGAIQRAAGGDRRRCPAEKEGSRREERVARVADRGGVEAGRSGPSGHGHQGAGEGAHRDSRGGAGGATGLEPKGEGRGDKQSGDRTR